MSKEKFRNILISFVCDYDNNKWSNDDVYDKYSIVLSQMFNDLEAKLAEKDRQLKVMRELKNRYLNYYKTCETECSQLKQQLAEKEKEIKHLQKQHEIDSDVIELMQQNREKDKISFAVEKLEEVKEFANKVDGCEFDIDYVISYIDNQIKEIKGEK